MRRLSSTRLPPFAFPIAVVILFNRNCFDQKGGLAECMISKKWGRYRMLSIGFVGVGKWLIACYSLPKSC